MVVESLEIKPYLLGDACYASWNYLLHNFKPVDGNLDKIMLDWQMNVSKVNNDNVSRILKNSWMILHCINAHVYWAFGIVVACCVLHNYCQLMELPSPPIGCQENPFCCARGQVPLLHKGQVASQHGGAMHVALFTNWMIVHTNPIWCSSWTFWKYKYIRSEILLYWSEIWNTSH